jgi:hypothetical protein
LEDPEDANVLDFTIEFDERVLVAADGVGELAFDFLIARI